MKWVCQSIANKISNQRFACYDDQYNDTSYVSGHYRSDFASLLDDVFASNQEFFDGTINTFADAQKGSLLSRALYFTQSPKVLQMIEGRHYLASDISFKVGNGFGYYIQNNNLKGLYIVITGKDHNGAFSSEEYINLLIQNTYDVIAISGNYYDITVNVIHSIFNLIRQDHKISKIEGIIIGAHGEYNSDSSHMVRLGYDTINTELLMQSLIQALRINYSIKVMLSSCYGGLALDNLQSHLAINE